MTSWLWVSVLAAQAIPADDVDHHLVRLGDAAVEVREAEEARLRELSSSRLPALRKALAVATNPEIRERLGKIIDHIERRDAGPTLSLGGLELAVKDVHLWRDFMPPAWLGTPDGGSPMMAVVNITIRNPGSKRVGIRFPEIRVAAAGEDGVLGVGPWGGRPVPQGPLFELAPGEVRVVSLRGDRGPYWKPGTAADVFLRVQVGEAAGLLGKRKVPVDRTV